MAFSTGAGLGGGAALKLNSPPMTSVTGTTKRWLPLACTVTLAVSVSPTRSGTVGTTSGMTATRPLSLGRPTSSHAALLVAWA
jgi:hypothetical protein